MGESTDPVRTLGGLQIRPELTLAELEQLPDLRMLVIPGADTYFEGHQGLLDTVGRLLSADVAVAAICGATLLLARGGFLDDRAHTSNAAEFLQYSGYAGGELYRADPVVTDRGITTASGLRAVPFTAEVLRRCEVYPADLVDAWERLYLHADPADYAALMAATDAFANA